MCNLRRQGTLRRSLLIVVAFAVAGCGGSKAPAQEDEVAGRSVEGWIYDPILVPLEGAQVRLVGADLATTSDAEGHFQLPLPDMAAYTLQVSAVGFRTQSQTVVFDTTGGHKRLDFKLEHMLDAGAAIKVHQFDGFIECSGFAVVGHNHGGGGEPTGENPLDCGSYGVTDSIWDVPVHASVTGVVLEIIWEPGTDLAENLLVLTYKVHDNGTKEFVGFAEGNNILRLQIGTLEMADKFPVGGTIRFDVQIGGGPDQEDVAYGAAVQQDFQAFTSLFYGLLPTPDYSVAQ